MKKLILLTSLASLLMIIGGVLGQGAPMPCPIGLDIITVPENANVGLHVYLVDSTGTIIARGVTGTGGDVTIDVAGVCTSYKAVIEECSNIPECTKTVAFNPSGFTKWDITAVAVPCPTYTPTVCETCPEDTTPYEECNSCCEECLDEGFSLTELLSYLGITLVAGGGVSYEISRRINTGKLEAKVTRHKHKVTPKGDSRKHSIYTIHKDERYRHRAGQINVPEEWV